MSKIKLLALGVVVSLGTTLMMTGATQAATQTFHITNTVDEVHSSCTPTSTDCSLRDAINYANLHLDDSIVIQLDQGTYSLTLTTGATDALYGDLDIEADADVNIQGPVVTSLDPSAMAVIDAGGLSRAVFVNTDGTLTMSGVAVTNGTDTTGGGIYNLGTATVDNSYFNANSAAGNSGTTSTSPTDGIGGAIYNAGSLVVNLSYFDSNSAFGGNGKSASRSTTFKDGQAGADAYGAAIANIGGTLTVSATTFYNNTAIGGDGGNGFGVGQNGGNAGQAYGGAIYSSDVATAAELTNDTFYYNSVFSATGGTPGTTGVAGTSTTGVGSALYLGDGSTTSNAFLVTHSTFFANGDHDAHDAAIDGSATIKLFGNILNNTSVAYDSNGFNCPSGSTTTSNGYNVYIETDSSSLCDVTTTDVVSTTSVIDDSDITSPGDAPVAHLGVAPVLVPTGSATDLIPLADDAVYVDARDFSRPEAAGEYLDAGSVELQDVDDDGLETITVGGTDTDDDGDGVDSTMAGGTDCDDDNATIFVTYYPDADGDGLGVDGVSICAGAATPTGYADNKSDTNDTDADNDGVSTDADCNDSDPLISTAITYYGDQDGDGLGNPAYSLSRCESVTPSGFANSPDDANDTDFDNDGVSTPVDCDDRDSAVTDLAILYFADADGDSLGNSTVTTTSCTGAPAGYVANPDDDNDNDADNDGVEMDVDCDDSNAQINSTQTYYADGDGDGFGDATVKTTVCSLTAPTGFVTDHTDGDDTDPTTIVNTNTNGTNTNTNTGGTTHTASTPTITGVSGTTAGGYVVTYSDNTTVTGAVFPKYHGSKSTIVKYLVKRDIYLMINPTGRAIAALQISDDGTTVTIVDRIKLSKKSFNAVTTQQIKRTVAGKKVRAFILTSGKKSRVVLVKLNTTGDDNVFLTKATAKISATVNAKKQITISKKNVVTIKTKTGKVRYQLNPKTWMLTAL